MRECKITKNTLTVLADNYNHSSILGEDRIAIRRIVYKFIRDITGRNIKLSEHYRRYFDRAVKYDIPA